MGDFSFDEIQGSVGVCSFWLFGSGGDGVLSLALFSLRRSTATRICTPIYQKTKPVIEMAGKASSHLSLGTVVKLTF